MVKEKSDKLAQMLKKHKNFTMSDSGKIHCELTNHQMTSLKEFQEYLKGRAYKRAIEGDYQLKDYSEHLSAHRSDPKFLFCNITRSRVANKKSAIEKHVGGKRYKKVLQMLKDQQAKSNQKQKQQQHQQQKHSKERRVSKDKPDVPKEDSQQGSGVERVKKIKKDKRPRATA